jgi:Domain of unknown function (DUF4382)
LIQAGSEIVMNKSRLFQWVGSALSASVVSLLAACGGGSDYDSTPAPSAAATGTLRVALTDAPACGFDHVYVTVERVRVHQTSSANDNDAGWSEVVLNPAQRIDLLGLTNGVLAELGQTPLVAGQYKQVRLVLRPNGGGTPANSVVPTGGAETALDTPSATQSGLKLIHAFTVAPNTLTDLLLDFDACRSVVRKGNGGFNLKPVIAVIPRTTTAIVGTVDPALIGVTVSVQKNGAVVRSTTPNANGDFVLSGLDPAQSPFDVVFRATSVTTSVVTATPITAGASTRISTTAAPITLPVAVTGVANGKILPISASASIRALQAVGSVPKIEVAHDNADATIGNYSLTLPITAPRLATYSIMLPLTFSSQAASAANYTLEAFATGYVTQSKAVTIGAMPVVNDFTLVAVP